MAAMQWEMQGTRPPSGGNDTDDSSSTIKVLSGVTIKNYSAPYNDTAPIPEEPEDFTSTVLKFGVSILVVGVLLLGAMVLVYLLSVTRRRVQKALERHTAQTRQFSYDNQVDILDEATEEEYRDAVGSHGVLVIDGAAGENGEASRRRLNGGGGEGEAGQRPDYQATSMAGYVERKGLPQARV